MAEKAPCLVALLLVTALSVFGQQVAMFVYPVNGQQNVDTSKPFQWTAPAGATRYQLYVGSALGGSDLVNSSQIQTTSYTVPTLPVGVTLYARIWSNNGTPTTWIYQDITFTAAGGLTAGGPAQFIYPVNGQQNVDTSKPFQWTAPAGATRYQLYVGSALGGSNLVNSSQIQTTSYTVPALPVGVTLYARIWSNNGTPTTWIYQDITFTAATGLTAAGPAQFTYPVNGQQNVDTSRPFQWTSAAGATVYQLYVGSALGGSDLVNSSQIQTTSYTVPPLLVGVTLYARIWSNNGKPTTWIYQDITFTAAGGPGPQFPPNYNTFQPPAVGGTYVDPVFGSSIKRISNAPNTPDNDHGGFLPWISDEYSTMSPFNSDNSRILLVHQSYFGLYDGTGVYLRDLPLEINASTEPRWSRSPTASQTIYYVHGNQLKTCDTSNGALNVVHTFSEYSAISGMGESDISFDGDHFVFAGDRRYVFVYRISTNTKGSTFDTGGQPFDSLYITPNNNVTITWNQSGTVRYTGIEMFDANLAFLRQVARAGGHMDVTLDKGNEVLVWANSNDPQPICNNGIVKILLATGQQTCLVSFDWSLAVHVSGPDNSGLVYVETYAPGNPMPPSGWPVYTNELLQIKLDGSQVVRLAHHRSRPYQINTYNWEPRISSSRDGSRVVFNSDYDLQVIDGYTAQYCDAYLIVVGTP